MKRFVKRLIILGVLVVVLITLSILQNSTAVCEFFATTVSRAWIWFWGHVLGWISVSFYEWSLAVVILGLPAFVFFIVFFLIKKRYSALVSLVLAVAIAGVSFGNVYIVSAGFAYNRNVLPTYVYREHESQEVNYSDALNIASLVVDELNAAYEQIDHDEKGNVAYPFSFSELNDLIAEEYAKLDDEYFSSYTPNVKKIANEWVMNELHISGVFFAPYGEPNVSVGYSSMMLPYTMAHELAHSKGVMRESEANTVAAYVLLSSDNPYLRYSALVSCYTAALSLVRLYPNSLSDYNLLYAKINEGVFKEIRNYNEYNSKFTTFDNVGKFFNDIYLKINGQGGTNSYQKPSTSEDTGEKDDDGFPILKIRSYSNLQNVLIGLYKNCTLL